MFFSAVLFGAVCLLTGCMEWDYDLEPVDFNASGHGLFIINEGCFQYGNATLSFYDTETEIVENEVFLRANGMKLGDVAQSMTIFDDKGWIVVNNSHVVFAIDLTTFRETGRIENLTSPRYIHFVNDRKAYVSQLWDNRIFIVDPKRCEVTGYINVPQMTMETGSTEQMVQIGRYVYCNCWSYQNKIIKIDTETDNVVGSLTVGINPTSLVVDKNRKLWTITDGGYEGSPYGYEAPELVMIDVDDFVIEKRFRFKLGQSPSEINIDSSGDCLYWLDEDVWKMEINSTRLPQEAFIQNRSTKYYGLTVDPSSGDVYVGDAVDYQQQGAVYRYSSDGILLDCFYVGVTPGAYCWK